MNILEGLNWRYATQKFAFEKNIPSDTLTDILSAGNLAATAYGLQPFEFILVTNQAIKEQLVPVSYGQEHVSKNSALIVVAIRTDIDETYIGEYVDRLGAARQLPPQTIESLKQTMTKDLTGRSEESRNQWAAKQAYIALGSLMAAASEAKIDNHALEGFNAHAYDEILNLTEHNLHSTVILALGYRAEDDQWQTYPKVRKSLENIVRIID